LKCVRKVFAIDYELTVFHFRVGVERGFEVESDGFEREGFGVWFTGTGFVSPLDLGVAMGQVREKAEWGIQMRW
jgi:hypothetical protein